MVTCKSLTGKSRSKDQGRPSAWRETKGRSLRDFRMCKSERAQYIYIKLYLCSLYGSVKTGVTYGITELNTYADLYINIDHFSWEKKNVFITDHTLRVGRVKRSWLVSHDRLKRFRSRDPSQQSIRNVSLCVQVVRVYRTDVEDYCHRTVRSRRSQLIHSQHECLGREASPGNATAS